MWRLPGCFLPSLISASSAGWRTPHGAEFRLIYTDRSFLYPMRAILIVMENYLVIDAL